MQNNKRKMMIAYLSLASTLLAGCNSNNNINETNQNSEDNDDNVIDIKMLKKQREQAKQRQKIKSFSINEDISYAELEETATCIIKIPKNNIGKSSSQNYGNMI